MIGCESGEKIVSSEKIEVTPHDSKYVMRNSSYSHTFYGEFFDSKRGFVLVFNDNKFELFKGRVSQVRLSEVNILEKGDSNIQFVGKTPSGQERCFTFKAGKNYYILEASDGYIYDGLIGEFKRK